MVSTYGYWDVMDGKARYELKQKLNQQRTQDFKSGHFAGNLGVADPLTGDEL